MLENVEGHKDPRTGQEYKTRYQDVMQSRPPEQGINVGRAGCACAAGIRIEGHDLPLATDHDRLSLRRLAVLTAILHQASRTRGTP